MNQREKDLSILKKAGRRVDLNLAAVFIGLCLVPVGVWFLLEQPLFAHDSSFQVLFVAASLVEIMVWLCVFFALSSGKSWTRILYIAGLLALMAFTIWVMWQAFKVETGMLSYIVWSIFLLVKLLLLTRFATWLYKSFYAKIFFDHTLQVYGKEPEPQPKAKKQTVQKAVQQASQPVRQSQPVQVRPVQSQPVSSRPVSNQPADQTQVFQPVQEDSYKHNPDVSLPSPGISSSLSRASQTPSYQNTQQTPALQPSDLKGRIEDEVVLEKEAEPDFYSEDTPERQLPVKTITKYNRQAIRTAVTVYGEMILFPMIVHLFDGQFSTYDGRNLFALNLMSTLCILTAAIWTIAIFYMFLKEPGAVKIVKITTVGQVGIILLCLWMLYGYYTGSVTYSIWVYIKFIGLDIIRNVLLFYGIYPAYSLPVIEPDEEDEDE